MDGAQPAPGLLASTLLSAARLQRRRVPSPASSGCAGLDEQVLGGGFRYGEISSIAGASGTGKTTVGASEACKRRTSLAATNFALNRCESSWSLHLSMVMLEHITQNRLTPSVVRLSRHR